MPSRLTSKMEMILKRGADPNSFSDEKQGKRRPLLLLSVQEDEIDSWVKELL
jgi:hypothetical protein